MKKSSIVLTVTALVLFTNCSGYRTVSAPSSAVPSGTKVSFEKMMNSAFARDYIGADIVTEAQFYAPNLPKAWTTKVPKGYIAFQVLPVGGEAKSSGFGTVQGDIVFIPKSEGDLIFDLKPGDKIELRGGARMRKGIIARSVEIVEFVASSVKKL